MQIFLQPTSDACMTFDSWMGDCTEGKFMRCTVNMTSDVHVYNVTYTYTEPSGSVCGG
jgi:hypothetical protein